MTQKERNGRIQRLVRAGKLIAALLFFFYMYSVITTIFLLATGRLVYPYPVLNVFMSVLMTGTAVVVIVLALRIVFSMQQETTPFTMDNARRLRVIGWLLIAYELIIEVSARLADRLALEVFSAEGVAVSTHFSMGGLLIVVGLAVLAISFVFQYGIELQRLSDETL